MFIFKRKKTLKEMLVDCYKSRIKHIEASTKLLKICLKMILSIGVPLTDKEEKDLSMAINTYDEVIQSLEEYVHQYRKYMNPG